MEKVSINVNNITSPPEKVRLMYEAVSRLVQERRDIRNLKVADITALAGIGKGTAYEYFSTKEELIINALAYEYARKILDLKEQTDKEKGFQAKCFCVMEWIRENKAYNSMLPEILHVELEGAGSCAELKGQLSGNFFKEAHDYIYATMDELLDEGYAEGLFAETDVNKRRLAFLGAMLQYAFVIMATTEPGFMSLGQEGLKEFVYQSMIRAL